MCTQFLCDSFSLHLACLPACFLCLPLYLCPPLCRLSLLWLRSRLCGGWTSVSWLRIEPCCASLPASLRQPLCRRRRTSDPLTSSVLLPPCYPLPQTHNFYIPLSSWCLYSPLYLLCCVPLRQVLHHPHAHSPHAAMHFPLHSFIFFNPFSFITIISHLTAPLPPKHFSWASFDVYF